MRTATSSKLLWGKRVIHDCNRMALRAGARSLKGPLSQFVASETVLAPSAALGQIRYSTVPEFWGKASPYTEGTGFLGTPPNHRDLAVKRPVSPHVFEMDKPTEFHYKMPINALSSIATRVSGFALSATSVGAGVLAFNGDLVSVVDFVRDSFLVYPARALVAAPLIYHYAAGIRHSVWDHAKYGMQSEKGDLLDPKVVDKLSWGLMYVTAAGTLGAVVYSF